jgi:hypothetical protein
VPVGEPVPSLGLKRSGAASGCRGLGQHARWASAVKDSDEPIQS